MPQSVRLDGAAYQLAQVARVVLEQGVQVEQLVGADRLAA
jgi:hypothetical protein